MDMILALMELSIWENIRRLLNLRVVVKESVV